jgi:hypothetical protein
MNQRVKFYFAIAISFISVVATAQQSPWVTFFGGSGPQFATDIQQTADDGYIIAAYDSENNSGNFYVVRLNEEGDIVWENNISKDNYSERAYSVIETQDGDFVVIGVATMLRRPWVVKLNSQGDTLWTSQWTNALPQNSAIVARGVMLPDSRIVVIGAEGQLGTQPNMFLVSLEGELLEQRTLNAVVSPGWYSGTIVTHIESTGDGGFMLTGTAGGGSSSKAFLWKFDQNADSVWTLLYDNPAIGMRGANSVKQLADGGYILAGYSSPNSNHACALRVDATGNVIWFQTYPDSLNTQATDVITWNDGTFLITEKRFTAAGQTIFESALLKIDSDGNLLNRDIITADDASVAIYRMRNTSDGGFVMAGEINEFMIINEQDLFVLKSDSWGDITTPAFNILVSDNRVRLNSPDLSNHLNISPNPVKTGHQFRLDFSNEIHEVEIYTLSGTRLLAEITGKSGNGLVLNAPESQGIYVVVLTTKYGEILTKRLVVI